MKNKNITLSILGIIAAFVSTFSGVYLANNLEDHSESNRYLAYVSVMEKNCNEILLNNQSNPSDTTILILTMNQALENVSLLESDNLINSFKHFSRASSYENERRKLLNSGELNLEEIQARLSFPPSKTKEEYEQKVKDFSSDVYKRKEHEANIQLDKWKEEIAKMCEILNLEATRVREKMGV